MLARVQELLEDTLRLKKRGEEAEETHFRSEAEVLADSSQGGPSRWVLHGVVGDGSVDVGDNNSTSAELGKGGFESPPEPKSTYSGKEDSADNHPHNHPHRARDLDR